MITTLSPDFIFYIFRFPVIIFFVKSEANPDKRVEKNNSKNPKYPTQNLFKIFQDKFDDASGLVHSDLFL